MSEDIDFLLSGKVKNQREPNNCDDRGNNVFHFLSFSGHRPDEEYNSENASCDIKMHEVHILVSLFSIVIEAIKNNIVKVIPTTNVYAGNLPVSCGENNPTTNDPNIIFAPSRKKLDNVLNISSSQTNSTKGNIFVNDFSINLGKF